MEPQRPPCYRERAGKRRSPKGSGWITGARVMLRVRTLAMAKGGRWLEFTRRYLLAQKMRCAMLLVGSLMLGSCANIPDAGLSAQIAAANAEATQIARSVIPITSPLKLQYRPMPSTPFRAEASQSLNGRTVSAVMPGTISVVRDGSGFLLLIPFSGSKPDQISLVVVASQSFLRISALREMDIFYGGVTLSDSWLCSIRKGQPRT